MKCLFLIVAVCTGLTAWAFVKADTLPDSYRLIRQLKAINLSKYKGRPVDTLLTHLPTGIVSMEVRGSVLNKKAAFLYAGYGNDVFVVVLVKDFVFMNPDLSATGNPTQNWSTTLFRKEAISAAIVLNGNCINGCQDFFRFQ